MIKVKFVDHLSTHKSISSKKRVNWPKGTYLSNHDLTTDQENKWRPRPCLSNFTSALIVCPLALSSKWRLDISASCFFACLNCESFTLSSSHPLPDPSSDSAVINNKIFRCTLLPILQLFFRIKLKLRIKSDFRFEIQRCHDQTLKFLLSLTTYPKAATSS